MKNKQLNSCQELLDEKRRLSELVRIRKARLDKHLDYFQQNAGAILLSTVSYHLLFKQLPIIGDLISQREANASQDTAYPAVLQVDTPSSPLQKAGAVLSMVWKIARPVLVSVAIKRFGNFFGKKR